MINIQKHFKLNNNYSTESIYDESMSTEGLFGDKEKNTEKKLIKLIGENETGNVKQWFSTFYKNIKPLPEKIVNNITKQIYKAVNIDDLDDPDEGLTIVPTEIFKETIYNKYKDKPLSLYSYLKFTNRQYDPSNKSIRVDILQVTDIDKYTFKDYLGRPGKDIDKVSEIIRNNLKPCINMKYDLKCEIGEYELFFYFEIKYTEFDKFISKSIVEKIM